MPAGGSVKSGVEHWDKTKSRGSIIIYSLVRPLFAKSMFMKLMHKKSEIKYPRSSSPLKIGSRGGAPDTSGRAFSQPRAGPAKVQHCTTPDNYFFIVANGPANQNDTPTRSPRKGCTHSPFEFLGAARVWTSCKRREIEVTGHSSLEY